MATAERDSEILVGAGGWAYFDVPGRDSLSAYSSAFNFVEVNSTYYEYPDLRTVRQWRSRVPTRFEFSVRCHKDIVRAIRNAENSLLDEVVAKMSKICNLLEANVLAVLVPNQYGMTDAALASGVTRIGSKFEAGETRIAVEVRSGAAKKALEAIRDNDMIHCVDVSREQPVDTSRIMYSRLFGKGHDNIYQFDDQEICEIATKAASPKFEKSILAFHGVRMYGDAARLKVFLQTGKFLQVTGQTGLDSLGAVLKEDTKFPTSKNELIARQGWKLFDLTVEKRVRVQKPLSRLPKRTYKNYEELMNALKPTFSGDHSPE